jgi:hypothetical protein
MRPQYYLKLVVIIIFVSFVIYFFQSVLSGALAYSGTDSIKEREAIRIINESIRKQAQILQSSQKLVARLDDGGFNVSVHRTNAMLLSYIIQQNDIIIALQSSLLRAAFIKEEEDASAR